MNRGYAAQAVLARSEELLKTPELGWASRFTRLGIDTQVLIHKGIQTWGWVFKLSDCERMGRFGSRKAACVRKIGD